MSIVKHILHYAAPMRKLESYDRFLFIGPHPDDIEIGAGATAAKLCAMGKSVAFCICTDGRYGDVYMTPGTSHREVIRTRRKEALHAASILEVGHVFFLELCDGGFYKRSTLEKRLAEIISEYRPDVILAPDPTVISECHVDHLKVGEAARKLTCLAPYGGIMERYDCFPAPVKAIAYYMTARPNTYVNTTGFLKIQMHAIFDAHVSQYPKGHKDSDSLRLYLKLRALQNGIKAHGCTGEAFRMLDQLHMHCLSEAGE